MRTRYINLEQASCLVLTLTTDSGTEGQGLVCAASLADINIVAKCLEDIFLPQLINKEVTSPEALWQELWLSKRNHLQSSYALYALATIDIAVWDIFAQLASQPLYQLLGIKQDYVVPYGNGGWLVDSIREIQNDIAWYLERGCKHFKMRVGCESDVSRLKAVRQAFGNDLILAVDANQYYRSFESAVEMSKHLADFNVVWFEESLFSSSVTELAKLAKLSAVPIATGENMNSHWQIQDICALKAAHILQPDVIYQGGITEFKRSAEVINQANLSMGAHLFHELSSSIAGLCSKHYVEHIDFFPNDLFINDFSIKDGKIWLPKTLGHGVTISKQALAKYRAN